MAQTILNACCLGHHRFYFSSTSRKSRRSHGSSLSASKEPGPQGPRPSKTSAKIKTLARFIRSSPSPIPVPAPGVHRPTQSHIVQPPLRPPIFHRAPVEWKQWPLYKACTVDKRPREKPRPAVSVPPGAVPYCQTEPTAWRPHFPWP